MPEDEPIHLHAVLGVERRIACERDFKVSALVCSQSNDEQILTFENVCLQSFRILAPPSPTCMCIRFKVQGLGLDLVVYGQDFVVRLQGFEVRLLEFPHPQRQRASVWG